MNCLLVCMFMFGIFIIHRVTLGNRKHGLCNQNPYIYIYRYTYIYIYMIEGPLGSICRLGFCSQYICQRI